MLIGFPLIALLVIGYIYRDDFGGRSLLTYALLWIGGLATVWGLGWSPGVFVVVQCLLAVAMLIQARVNPRL